MAISFRSTCRAVAASALLATTAAQAACQVEMLDLPVRMVSTRAVATVRIDGKPVTLTVDTGAFYSMLTEAAASQLGLRTRPLPNLRVSGLTGNVDTRVARVDKLQLLKGEIPRVDFIVGGNEPGAGTLGLLGRNLLSSADAEYDLANGVIRLAFPNDDCARSNLAYWAGTSHVTELKLEDSGFDEGKTPALRARVKINGREFTALFDTGATTLLTAATARRAGVPVEQLKPGGVMYGAGRGRVAKWTGFFERFEIGDEQIANNRLDVGDFSMPDADLLLGIDFFLSHRIYVSKRQEKMYITYNGGPIFALNKTETSAEPPADAASAAADAQELDPDALARRAASLAVRREDARALALLDRAVQQAPRVAAYQAQRGSVLMALKRPADALKALDTAVELDPADADARFRRAQLRLVTRDHDGARSDFETLDAALPAQSNLRLSIASAYLALDQPERAIPQYDRWLASHPQDFKRAAALNGRCWARARAGIELDRALRDCDDALDDDGDNAAFYDSRGWVQLRSGRDAKAVGDFDRALRINAALAGSLYGRGIAKLRLGSTTPGEVDLKAAREIDADVERRLKREGLLPDDTAKP